MQLTKNAFISIAVLAITAAATPTPIESDAPQVSKLSVQLPPSPSAAVLTFCTEPNQGGDCIKLPIPEANAKLGDPEDVTKWACLDTLDRYVNFWTRSVHLENPRSDTLWNCNIFPFYLPAVGEIQNRAACPTNLGDPAKMVEVNKDNAFNDIETEAEKGFKDGIGGFLCSCTNVEGGQPCEFPDRDIWA